MCIYGNKVNFAEQTRHAILLKMLSQVYAHIYIYRGNVKIIENSLEENTLYIYLFIYYIVHIIQQKHVHILANQLLGYVNTESSSL